MGATAAILAWTTATVPVTFAAASSDKSQQTVRNGVKRYVGVAATPIASAPGGPAFATLYVSAPVTMVGTEARTTHVISKLWIYGDAAASGPLYAAPQGVEVGRLDAVRASRAIAGTDGNGWNLIEIEGYLPTDAVVDNLMLVWRLAEFNYQTICADCHSLHAAQDRLVHAVGCHRAQDGKERQTWTRRSNGHPQMAPDHIVRERHPRVTTGTIMDDDPPREATLPRAQPAGSHCVHRGLRPSTPARRSPSPHARRC